MTGRFFVINAAGSYYSRAPGRIVSWETRSKANEYQTAQSAQHTADKYPGARVVEMRGKTVCEVRL